MAAYTSTPFVRIDASHPGTGKTVSAMLSARTPCLWLTPASLKLQAMAEINKFLPYKTVVVISGNKAQRAKLWKQTAHFYIANYEVLLSDEALIKAKGFVCCVADEMTRLNNPKNKTYQALERLAIPDYRLMSGTWLVNSLLDCYGAVNLINPWAFNSETKASSRHWKFLMRYAVKNSYNSIVGVRNKEELLEKIRPYYIAHSREDVLKDLPEVLTTDIPVDLCLSERKLYKQLKQRILLDLKPSDVNKKDSPHTLTETLPNLIALRQLCCSPQLLGEVKEHSKLDALVELMGQLVGHKVIIFSEFAQMCKLLRSTLEGKETWCAMIVGEMDHVARDHQLTRFKTKVDCNVLILSSKTAAHGLNITEASVIINYDFPWSYASYDQRISRARRRGQTKQVLVYNMIVNDSIEQRMQKLILKKKALDDLIVTTESILELI